MIIIKLFNCR